MTLSSVSGRLRSGLALTATAVLAGVLLGGCGLLNGAEGQRGNSGGAGGAGRRGLEKSNVTVGAMTIVDNATFYLAEEKGYFADEGLNVKVKKFKSTPVSYPALNSGELDFTMVNYVSALEFQAKGTNDFTFVADGYQANENSMIMLGTRGSKIREPKDLVGKKVSIHQPGSVNELLLKAVLQANGVNPNSVKYLPIKFPDIPAALESGQIDAGSEVEPFITQAEQSVGAVPLFNMATGPTADMPLSGYATTAEYAKKNPRTVAAFQRAMRRAQEEATSNPQSVRSVLRSGAGIDKNVASLAKLGTYPTTLTAKRLQRVADLMKTYGYLDRTIDVAPLIQPEPTG